MSTLGSLPNDKFNRLLAVEDALRESHGESNRNDQIRKQLLVLTLAGGRERCNDKDRLEIDRLETCVSGRSCTTK